MVRRLEMTVSDDGWVTIGSGQDWRRHGWQKRHGWKEWHDYEEQNRRASSRHCPYDLVEMKGKVDSIEMAVGKLSDKIEGMLHEPKESAPKKVDKGTDRVADDILELQQLFLKLEKAVNTISNEVGADTSKATVTKLQGYDNRLVQFENVINCKFAGLAKELDEKFKECMAKAEEVDRTLWQRSEDLVRRFRDSAQMHGELKTYDQKLEHMEQKLKHEAQNKAKTHANRLWKTLVLLCNDGVEELEDDYKDLKYEAFDYLSELSMT
eukprot:TRINITY_DN3421_c0_g1_i3.p1 TRINITY_DN3421_c0_g1~~TRINITY_DN3421_c0_g1_i3.p1  ORF type:complete len:266 (-),score=80.59 TRINITY_DN3421_c0_g1_i3:540-1337(-)